MREAACMVGFTGIAPRAVFLSVVVRPWMLGIMAGVYQKDRSLDIVDSCSGMCLAGFAGRLLLALCALQLSAGPDARHHGLYGPEGHLCHLHEDWLLSYFHVAVG